MKAENNTSHDDLIKELRSLIEQGQSAQAIEILSGLRERFKDVPDSWEMLGTFCLQLDQVTDAVDYLDKAIGREPAGAKLLFKYCRALTRAGRHMDAINACRELLALQPDHAAAHITLANNLRMACMPEDAIGHARQALELQPDYPAAAIQLAISLQTTGDFGDAADVLRRALVKQPAHAVLNFRLGNILAIIEAYEEAVASYREAINNNPDFDQAWYRMAGAQLQLGHLDEALASYRSAQAIRPDFEDAAAGEAGILMILGDREGALRRIQPFIDQGSRNISIVTQFAELSRYSGSSGAALERIEELLHTLNPPPDQKARLHFSAGDLHAHHEAYEPAFGHYRQANALRHNPPAAQREIRRLRAVQTVFTRERLDSLPRASTSSERPVFIVGMPRSGTSLVEQILAAHPDVFGAGELMHINRIAATLPQTLNTRQPYPRCIDQLTRPAIEALAADYLQQLERLSPDAARVTDKMPHNFLNLGLIDRLLPGARVIHCRRDPMDTCLSCFTHNLAGIHAYSNDLATLGAYYRAYRALMQHWQQVLHIPLLDVDYEALVNDQEAVTRRLLAFCGLEWDARCLRFHESARVAATASHNQVRQPLYRGAIGKWQRYAHQLQPLVDALADAGEQRRTR